MIRLACYAACLLLVACKQDPATVPATDQVTSAQTVPSDASPVQSTEVAEGAFVMPEVEGFNYLTDCDSFLVSTLELKDPNGEEVYGYLLGSCVTNKSYDLVAVPRSGAVPVSEFGEAQAVLAKAQSEKFKNHIVYAMTLPKIYRVDQGEVLNIYPANVVVERFDPPRWNRLGVDAVPDAAGYETFLWNVLHDGQLKYN